MVRAISCLLVTLLLVSCASQTQPKPFVTGVEPGWTSVELQDNITFDQAWAQAVDVLAKKFELEVISKEGGYIRKAWIYTWWKAGQVTQNYRVRSVMKFAPDKRGIDVKNEANYLRGGERITGFDDRLLQTVKTDL